MQADEEHMSGRRKTAAVIGGARVERHTYEQALALGEALVDAGFRIVCGGRTGVMEAACRGARSSSSYREGDTTGILPGYDASDANDYVDTVICTGMGHARNAIVVASADVVIAIAGGAGTMSEIALAWQLGKPIIALGGSGWGAKVAGAPIDERRDDIVHHADTPTRAVAMAMALIEGRGAP